MGMSYQVEEIVVSAFAHVVGSGITIAEYLCGVGWNIGLNHQY
jgi:hypothetical protein